MNKSIKQEVIDIQNIINTINRYMFPAILLDQKGNLIEANECHLNLFNQSDPRKKQNLFNNFKTLIGQPENSKSIKALSDLAAAPFITNINNSRIQWITITNIIKEKTVYQLLGHFINDEVNHKYLTNILIDNVPAQIFWKDLNLIYLGCNKSFVKSLNLDSKQDVIGKSDYELPVSIQDSKKFRDDDMLIILSKQPKLNIEEQQVLSNGQIKHLLTSKVPLYNNKGTVVGVLAVYTDITERKLSEVALQKAKYQAESADRAKAEFIANMSHDIRTPLTGIVGLSSMLVNNALSDENKESARMLNLSGEQLLSLLNSVLDIVSSDSINQDSIELSSFSIHNLLHNIFELELPAIKLKNLDLQLKLDDEIPPFIEADKGKIYRVLLNLLSNSIKFTEEGCITIEAKLIDIDHNDTVTLEFIVSDTGIGIPKTDTDKIFNAFYRVHPSYEGKYTGFGVGLHLVKQYVDVLGGDISVKSIEGMGTRFCLTLHVKKATTPSANVDLSEIHNVQAVVDKINKPTENVLQTVHTDTKTSKAHILLIEDNPMAIKVADMILTNAGATTEKAFNSTDALALFKEKQFDFVISDIGLPDYSGFELAQKMIAFEQENRPDSKLTPIIGLTAHAKQEAFLQGNECGMIEVCEKPFTAKMAETYIDMFGNASPDSSNTLKQQESVEQEQIDLPLLDVELGISQLGSIDDLKEMLELMINQSMVIITDEINKHFLARDWESFGKTIHKFKSSCLYCATTELLKYTQELESLAKEQNETQITLVYSKFQNCLVKTKQYIETWLSMFIE